MEDLKPYSDEQVAKYRKWWPGVTISEVFNRACDVHPEKEALVYGKEKLTFSHLTRATSFMQITITYTYTTLEVLKPYQQYVYV